MNGTDNSQSDSFLLVLDEKDFVSVGALLGRRARPASESDTTIVESWLDSDTPFSQRSANLLVTAMPGIPHQ